MASDPLTLREQVARRLWFVFYWPDRDGEDIEHYDHLWRDSDNRSAWLRAADECLRIARWNRMAGSGAPESDLTLPPDDWRTP